MFKMREIKFRAWVYDEEKEEDKMVNVIGIFFKGNSFIPHRVIIDDEEKIWLLQNSELMQFTGLKDSKGKEIYEGDIIKHEFGLSKKSLIGIVRYNKEFARFQVESSSDFAGLILTTTLKTEEVIGNEFENPELLKEVLNVN